MAEAVERVAKEVPTTVMRPVPSQYFLLVKGMGKRDIWSAERNPEAMRETATIWFCWEGVKPSWLAKMIGGVIKPAVQKHEARSEGVVENVERAL
jgi:hypothetical protein